MKLTSYKKEETGVQIFDFEGSGIRTVNCDGEPWFVAADVCSYFGIVNHRNIVARLDEDEKGVHVLDTLGGAQRLTVVNESGLYHMLFTMEPGNVRGITEQQRAERALKLNRFKRWITHEVLPAIRKHGVYAVDHLLENPDALIRALTAYKEEREKNLQLQTENSMQKRQLAELRPKGAYYDYVLKSKDLIPVTWIAKGYGMSAVNMNLLLSRLGVQFNRSGVWILYQKYAERGYTHSSTFVYEDDEGRIRSRMFTRWTQKGRLFLYDLLKKNGILPLMERTASKGIT